MVLPKPTNRSTPDAQVWEEGKRREEKVKRRLWCSSSVCSLLGVATKGQQREATKDIWYPYSSSLINGGHEMVRIHLTHVHIHRYTMMVIHLSKPCLLPYMCTSIDTPW